MLEKDKTIPLRLPWQIICKLACKAMIEGKSLNEICNDAIQAYGAKTSS